MDTDPKVIARKLNHQLNEIAVKIIKEKKIQNEKEEKDFDNRESKEARKATKNQSMIANDSGDVEENRLLKNKKNLYSKLEKKKKHEFEEKALMKTKYQRKL